MNVMALVLYFQCRFLANDLQQVLASEVVISNVDYYALDAKNKCAFTRYPSQTCSLQTVLRLTTKARGTAQRKLIGEATADPMIS
jgi:hypothetical protein